ncbi:MAG: hypothetical protein ACI4OL_05290 [Gemmiger sp.]
MGIRNRLPALAGRHRFFAAVILIQVIWLLARLAACFQPVYSAQWPAQQLESVQSTLAEAASADGRRALAAGQESALQALKNDANAETGVSWLRSDPCALPAGLYRCTLNYTSDSGAPGAIGCECTDGSALCPVQQLDGSGQTSVRCWLYTGSSGASFVVYMDDPSLTVQSLSVEELPGWRWTRLFTLLFLFAAADALWLLLMPDGPFRLNARRRCILLFLCGVTALVSLPALSGFAGYGVDLEFHLARISGVAEGLRSGQFPVRIYPDALNGYGYASPLFYGDLLLYFPASLYLAGFPLYQAYNCYVVGLNLLTAVITFCCLRGIFRSGWLSATGTALYLTASYRLFNLYYRPALGEFSAQAFLPLVLYGFWALLAPDASPAQRRRCWLPLMFGFTGVIQTHIISTEVTSLAAAVLCLCFFRRVLRRDALLPLLKGAGGTILLNLWFLLPFLSMMGGEYRCTDTGVLFDAGAYALSLPQMLTLGSDEMDSVRLGGALVLGALLYLLCRVRWQQLPRAAGQLGLVCSVGGGAALVLASTLFPWDRLDELLGDTIAHYLCAIQYPFRWLIVAALLLSVAAVCAVAIVQHQQGRRAALACATALCALGCAAAWMDCGVYVRGTYGRNRTGSAAELTLGAAASGLEYLPATFDADTADTGLLPGNALVGKAERRGLGYTITASNSTDTNTSIELPLTFYPGYTITANTGGDLSVQRTEHAAVAVVLAPGYDGTFTVAFREPRIWRLAETISLLFALWLAFMPLHVRFRSRKGGTK